MFDIGKMIKAVSSNENLLTSVISQYLANAAKDTLKKYEVMMSAHEQDTSYMMGRLFAAAGLLYPDLTQQILLQKDLREFATIKNIMEIIGLETEEEIGEFAAGIVHALKNETTGTKYLALVELMKEPLELIRKEAVEILQRHVVPGKETLVREMVESAVMSTETLLKSQVECIVRGDLKGMGEAMQRYSYSVAAAADRASASQLLN